MDHVNFVHNEQHIYIVWIFYLSCYRLQERYEEQTAQRCHLKSYLCKVFKILYYFSALGIFRAFSTARCDQLPHWTTRSCLQLLCAEICIFKAGRDGVCLQNLSAWEVETGKSGVQDQPQLQETLSQSPSLLSFKLLGVVNHFAHLWMASTSLS